MSASCRGCKYLNHIGRGQAVQAAFVRVASTCASGLRKGAPCLVCSIADPLTVAPDA